MKNNSKYKVALISICLNELYWPYQKRMIESAKKFFLKGHEVDFLVWTDMPKEKIDYDAIIFPTEPFEWPLPTLHRYSLFLKEEERLKEYDYLLYCDSDMLFASRVGNEILGTDLTAGQHPMYALNKNFIPPYEPNPESKAFIPRLGRILEENGKKRLEPLYLAGGFQGGTSESFIKAMKVMKKWIDEDFANGYIPIWNDESIWNAYLFRLTKTGILPKSVVVLSPEYICPDSLNRAYYQRVWGKNYVPRIITLTKQFSLTKEGGMNLNNNLRKV